MGGRAEFDLTRVLCGLEELRQAGCREFRIGGGDWPLRGFVVSVGGGARAYVNRCAHQAYPLNCVPHQFLTHDRSMILCAMHGAIFEKDTGLCVAGPCSGQWLIGLPVRIEAGYVLLAEEADADELAARYA